MEFRIVNCYLKSILPEIDEALHLVSHPRDIQTLCQRDVSNMTMIPTSLWETPDQTVRWCKRCSAKLAKLKRQASEGGKNVRLTQEVIDQVSGMMASGLSQCEACRRLGVPQSTVSRAMKRLKAAG